MATGEEGPKTEVVQSIAGTRGDAVSRGRRRRHDNVRAVEEDFGKVRVVRAERALKVQDDARSGWLKAINALTVTGPNARGKSEKQIKRQRGEIAFAGVCIGLLGVGIAAATFFPGQTGLSFNPDATHTAIAEVTKVANQVGTSVAQNTVEAAQTIQALMPTVTPTPEVVVPVVNAATSTLQAGVDVAANMSPVPGVGEAIDESTSGSNLSWINSCGGAALASIPLISIGISSAFGGEKKSG